MYIVQVSIHVKEESIASFKDVAIQNAQKSILEEGVARFDLLQQQDDSTKFMLLEVYHSKEDHAKHRTTDHYAKWREAVPTLLVEPYTIATYDTIFPEDTGWKK